MKVDINLDYWDVASKALDTSSTRNNSFSKTARDEVIIDVVKRAKNDLMQSQHLGLDDINKIRSTLFKLRNFSNKQLGIVERIFIAFTQFLAKFLPLDHKPPSHELRQVLNDVNDLFDKMKKNLSGVDKRMLTILSDINRCLDEKIPIKWENKRLFNPGDKEFYFKHIESFLSNNRLLPILKDYIDLKKEIDSSDADYEFGLRSIQIAYSLIKLHKLDKRKHLSSLLDKASTLFQKLKENPTYEPTSREKLTISEFALIDKLDVMLDVEKIQDFKDMEWLPESSRKLIDNLEKLTSLAKEMKTQVVQQTTYSSGAIGFSNAYRSYATRDKLDIDWKMLAQMSTTRSHYHHAGIFNRGNSELRYAQVISEFFNDPISLTELLYTDFYELDWDKLIHSSAKTALSNMYGKKWKQVVNDAFGAIIQDFHKNKDGRFDKIVNEGSRRDRSIWLTHKGREQVDLEKMAFNNQAMFCSEFVGKSLAVCLNDLQNVLKEAILDYEKEIKLGENKQIINQKINVINLPFDKKENFEAMHPGYLARLIKPIAEKKEIPKLIQQLVNLKTEAKVINLNHFSSETNQ